MYKQLRLYLLKPVFLFSVCIFLILVTQKILAASAFSSPVVVPDFVHANIGDFFACKKQIVKSCGASAESYKQYQLCLKNLQVGDQCKPFLTFSKLSGMLVKDSIEITRSSNNPNIALIHLYRYGANYSGDYYIISKTGDFVNITGTVNTIDATSDKNYTQIKQQFPKAEIWSLVEPNPEWNASPTGDRLGFRFPLLNGCHACARAGYAYVDYNFDQTGKFLGTKLIQLTK